MALAHFKAAFLQSAVGHRHALLVKPEFVSMKEIADILYEEFSSKGYKIPREEEQGFLSKATIDTTRMLKVLEIEPTPLRKTIVDMANSLIENGIAKKME